MCSILSDHVVSIFIAFIMLSAVALLKCKYSKQPEPEFNLVRSFGFLECSASCSVLRVDH